jgi:hypothetical protein
MATIRPEVNGRADLEPLGVSPRETARLLNIGQTRVWALIGSGELESYKEGRSRKVTMRSIRARHERQLAVAPGTDLTTEAAQPRRRGRPLKASGKEVRP